MAEGVLHVESPVADSAHYHDYDNAVVPDDYEESETETYARLHALDEEITTYLDKKDELVRQAENKYVLIKGTQIIGIFDTEEAALKVGYRKYLDEPFLAHQITKVEPIYHW